jgi:predicted PurR-regulated permease PerM
LNDYGIARMLSRLFFVVVATLAVLILYFAKILLLPLALAILFAFLLAPLVAGLERIRVPRTLATAVVILGFATVLAFVGWILSSQLVAIANDLPSYRENITQKMSSLQIPSNSALSRARRAIEALGDELTIPDSSAMMATRPEGNVMRKPLGSTPERPVQVREVAQTPGRLDQLGGVAGALTTAFLSIVLTFFVLLQRKDLRNRLIRLTGDHNLRVMTEALSDASRRVSRYFSLQVSVNTVYGAIIFIALHFIGLPHALLFGAIAAICRFIPYIGWPVATLIPTVLSLAVFHGWTKSILIVLIFLCLEITVFNYAEPRIYGRHIGLSSLAILMAASFWTLIWGPVGLVLSVPLTVCLVVMGRHIPSLEFLTIMLGDQPAVPLSSCFYQRLLAHDEHEAGEILANSSKDNALEGVYDSVLIPALMMSEEDRMYRDLEESTVGFIRQTARDLIEEFGLRESPEPDNLSNGGDAPSAAGEGSSPERSVMCLPVLDETDELAALMLAQVLSREGTRSLVAPVRRLTEVLAAVSADKPDLVILCGLPPFAVARSQRLYRAIRARNPQLKIVVAILNYPDDVSEIAQAISDKEEIRVLTKLSQAVAEICKPLSKDQSVAGIAEAGAIHETLPGRTAA